MIQSNNNLPESIRKINDKDWLELLIKSINYPMVEGIRFPGFPSIELQSTFVGSSNAEALQEAYPFYVLVKEFSKRQNIPIDLNCRLLDFGCGWGRFLRFFWKDIDINNLYGCDVNSYIIDVCKSLEVPGNLSVIDPKGKLPYPNNFFDVIMAYSVFTHLPQDINLHWEYELARVSRPGCVFCLTLESSRFLDAISTIPDDSEFFWHKMLLKFKPQIGELKTAFNNGGFVFLQSNSEPEAQGVYGDAVVPLSFIQQKWGNDFDIIDCIDDASRFFQAVLVVQRK